MSLGGAVEFRVGSVLSRSIWVLRRNAVVFGALAMLFTWPSLFVSGETGQDQSPGSALVVSSTGDIGGLGTTAIVAVVVAVMLFVLILYMLASCTMVYGTFQVLRNRPVGVGDCIRRGLPAVPRVIGIAILSVLAFLLVGGLLALPGFLILSGSSMIGFVWMFAAFLIPGLMIYTALWVAVPAAVVERTSVADSMRRSTNLTKGCRWRVFGVLLVLAVLNLVAETVISLPFDTAGIAYSIVGFAVTAFFTAWSAVAATVAYYDLRSEREGIGIDDIAAIFG